MPKVRRNDLKGRKINGKSNKFPLGLVLAGTVILLVATIFAFQKKPTPFTPQFTGGPSLKADKEKVDLGNEKLGSSVQVAFTLTNAGDQTLQISKAPYIEVIEGC